MKEKFQVGDLIESKSNGVMWIVTDTKLSASSPQGYCVTLQRSTWMKRGHGGSSRDDDGASEGIGRAKCSGGEDPK